MSMFTAIATRWRKRRLSDASHVTWPEKRKFGYKRSPRPGDTWRDASGRVHVLTVWNEDGDMTTDGVSL
jgi:hypothetical protein